MSGDTRGVSRRRWLLLSVVAMCLLAASVGFLLVRDDGSSRDLTTAGDPTTTTRAPSTENTATTETTGTTDEASTTTASSRDGAGSSTTSGPAKPPGTTGTTRPPTTTATTTVATAPPPPYQASIETVTAEQLGSSWRPGCPLGVDQLRAVNVSHWGYDGVPRIGRLIVEGAHADRMVAVFRDLYAARFPVQQIVPIDRYGSDDQASMRANNTSGFNCRYVTGTTRWSEHSYGRAVDVNPLVNPYVRNGTVDPPEGAPYADRSRTDPGMIHADDAAVRAFARQGWAWGGYWSSGKDYQHFSASGR